MNLFNPTDKNLPGWHNYSPYFVTEVRQEG
jgi:hypothetical protein